MQLEAFFSQRFEWIVFRIDCISGSQTFPRPLKDCILEESSGRQILSEARLRRLHRHGLVSASLELTAESCASTTDAPPSSPRDSIAGGMNEAEEKFHEYGYESLLLSALEGSVCALRDMW